MLSVLSLVQAWVRVGLIPAVVYLLVAQIRPPLLGWPRQERSATIAAWLLLACVPVSGLARLGEIDVVLLAVASWIALGNVVATDKYSAADDDDSATRIGCRIRPSGMGVRRVRERSRDRTDSSTRHDYRWLVWSRAMSTPRYGQRHRAL